MKLSLVALAVIALSIFSLGQVTTQTDASEESRPRIDISLSTQVRPSHGITLDEIVSLREVTEPLRSPDGSRVAFLVTQGFRDCDCYHTALYVVATAAGSVPAKVLEEPSLSALRWTPDGRYVSYLSAKSGSQQLWRVDPTNGQSEQVFTHTPGEDQTIQRLGYHPSDVTPVGVFTYEWSPDGQAVAFTTSPRIDKEQLEKAKKSGVLFDEHRSAFDLLEQQWIKVPTQVWVYELAGGQEKQVWENPHEISTIAWSPDGQSIAVAYSAPPKLKESQVFFNEDVGILTLATGAFKPVATTEAAEVMPTWSPDGQFLAFASILGYETSFLGVYEVKTGKQRELARGVEPWHIWWTDNSQNVVFQTDLLGKRRTRTGLFTVPVAGGKTVRLTSEDDHVSDCDGMMKRQAVCIWQSSNIPPSPAMLDLSSGKLRSLAAVNPELKDITLGHVSELRWSNSYGDETTGYLIRPFNFEVGRRYPLLIILYGFEGKFVTQAEWLSSYPAQAFAREGFAVLMTNYPPYDDWKGQDFARGSVAEAYSPLASIEAAIKNLVKEGIADPSRVGIMGISYGGFLTEFAITHSKSFKVSSLVDGGGYSPVGYWLSNHEGQEENERALGGPPSGSTYANWLKLSPPLNVANVMGPVLMGFNSNEAVYGFEMLSALRREGIPVEFWVYPGEGHIFTTPEHRFISMQRNLDWFNFWLYAREDPDPAKQEQYDRWREMRKQLASRAHRGRAESLKAQPGESRRK